MRLRTHHKRKVRAIKREREAMRKFERQLLELTGKTCMESAVSAFVVEFGKAINAVCEALRQVFASAFTPKPVMLDAEPFWDEWPEIIGHTDS